MMIRRAAVLATAVILAGGFATEALAASTGPTGSSPSRVTSGNDGFCVYLGNGTPSSRDGICISIPTH